MWASVDVNKYMDVVHTDTLCTCMCVHTEMTDGLSKAGKILIQSNSMYQGKDAGHCLGGAWRGAAHGLNARTVLVWFSFLSTFTCLLPFWQRAVHDV